MKNITNTIVKLIGAFLAVTIVTTAHYGWQMIKTHYPHSVFPVYCISFILLVLGGYFIIKRHSQNSYKQYHQLSNTSLFLLCTNWGVYFAFPSMYNPYNWAWSFSNDVIEIKFVQFLSSILIIAGLVGLVVSLFWLGMLHSTGQLLNHLKTNGPYRFTRNPQLVTIAFIVLGYTTLRPSLYAIGWLVLFSILAHFMIISEEEHLYNIFGEEYKKYCLRTPRYLRIYPRQNKNETLTRTV
jgi:hypothetical protein